MNDSKPRLYGFDLFGTLVHEKPLDPSYEELVRELAEASGYHERIQQDIGRFVRDVLQTKPDATIEEMVEQLLEHFELVAPPTDKKHIVDAWSQGNETALWFPDSLDVLEELRRNSDNHIVLITNVSAPAWETVNKKLGLTGHFDAVFPSCEVRASKPADAIWKAVEKAFPGHSYTMIGDTYADDIEPTTKRGWHAHWLQTPGVTKDILTKLQQKM